MPCKALLDAISLSYRSVDVIRQFDVIHEIYNMSSSEFVSLLPKEFNHRKAN
jgi:hypothetical protein